MCEAQQEEEDEQCEVEEVSESDSQIKILTRHTEITVQLRVSFWVHCIRLAVSGEYVGYGSGAQVHVGCVGHMQGMCRCEKTLESRLPVKQHPAC